MSTAHSKSRLIVFAVVLAIVLQMGAFAANNGNFKKIREYAGFSDVAAGTWYESGVKLSYELGLFDGTSGTTFAPEGKLTLAQSIKLAACLHSIYHTGKAEFVQGNPWHQVYVDYALQQKIIPAPYENYNAEATRAQFAQIFAAALPADALTKINEITQGDIPDVDITAGYAQGVYLLYNAGILTGSDAQGTFAPESTISRGEAATIVTRMADATLRKVFTLEPGTEDGQPVAMKYYKEFPVVPDFGAMYGYDVHNSSVKQFIDDYTGTQFTSTTFTYVGVKSEDVIDYALGVLDDGYLCTWYSPTEYEFRSTTQNDTRIILYVSNAINIVIDKGIANVPTASPVTYYPTGYQVPDFASVSGLQLISYGTYIINGVQATHYNYDAEEVDDKWIQAYQEQLFLSGYEFESVDIYLNQFEYMNYQHNVLVTLGFVDGMFSIGVTNEWK